MSDLIQLRTPSFEVDLCPAIGGSIARFAWSRPDGSSLDLLRPATAEALRRGDVEAMGCFPLTPFSNRLRDGRTIFQGRQIALPRNTPGPHVEHGHGWQRPWRLGEVGADHATLHLDHQADAWPFPYEMRQHFRLRPDGLQIGLTARNRGDAAMPYGFGLHPYFPRTPACSLSAVVEGFWETDDEVMPLRHGAVPPALQLESGMKVEAQDLDNVLTGWDGRFAIRWPERNAALSVTAEAPLRFLILYTPPGEDYFCAEPVSHGTDAFNLAAGGQSDTGMIVLAPGESVSARVAFLPE